MKGHIFKLVAAVMLWLLCLAAHAGTHHYYYTDPQGTVLAKADASGVIIASYDYAPYGAAVASMSPAPNGPGYTGHVNDADSGLVYMQARYYDPAVGGFLSVDPVGPSPGSLFHLNRYDYANNNPIANVDPDGLSSTDGVCMGNMQCISSGSAGGGSVSASSEANSVSLKASSQQAAVANAASQASRYGRYKMPSGWSFKIDPRYAYRESEYSPTILTDKPSNDPTLRGVPAESDENNKITTFYQGAFQKFNNQYLFYRDVDDIKPMLELRSFTMSANSTLLFITEHEFVHIILHSDNDPEGEGVANFWGSKAADSYMRNGGH